MGPIHWIVFDTHGMECNFTATTLKCFWPWVMLLTQTVKANNLFPWYCRKSCRITGAMWKHGQDVFFETLLKMLSHFGLLKFHCSRINSSEQSYCICHCKQTTVISSNLLWHLFTVTSLWVCRGQMLVSYTCVLSVFVMGVLVWCLQSHILWHYPQMGMTWPSDQEYDAFVRPPVWVDKECHY